MVTMQSLIVVLLLHVQLSLCDVYLHMPPGSNNRLREAQNNRRNGNRLFDSQNNNQGGYNVGDDCSPPCRGDGFTAPGAGKGTYGLYPGSVMTIEWTAQHSCSDPRANCNFVLQYACDDTMPGLRDGVEHDTIPEQGDPNRGQHETPGWYERCKLRERNPELFIADQQLNGNTARFTRQNPNGARRGLECPEERDYYPYWYPTPWIDIAVLTDDPDRCDYYEENSNNVRPYGQCMMTNVTEEECPKLPTDHNTKGRWLDGECHIAQFFHQDDCETKGGLWVNKTHNREEPECLKAGWTRDNHLGSTDNGYAFQYNWTIPDHVSDACVFRLRYNVTTDDYDGWATDYKQNGAKSPIKDEPVIPLYDAEPGAVDGGALRSLKMNIQTDQTGRVFQDRSHRFRILERPAELKGQTIRNLNVKGRRGNIVQVYPAVEYGFVPEYLEVDEGDVIHWQWTGSDNQPPNQAGNGLDKTDRSNVVQMSDHGLMTFDADIDLLFHDKNQKPDHELATKMAFLDQDPKQCTENPQDDQDPNNCAILNQASAYFSYLQTMHRPGEYTYMSSRNNDFSNRSQKGFIRVNLYDGVWQAAKRVLADWWVITLVFVVIASVFVGKYIYYKKLEEKQPQRVRDAFALHDYSVPKDLGKGSFRKGEDLRILENIDKNWVMGYLDGDSEETAFLIPKTFFKVKQMEKSASAMSQRSQGVSVMSGLGERLLSTAGPPPLPPNPHEDVVAEFWSNHGPLLRVMMFYEFMILTTYGYGVWANWKHPEATWYFLFAKGCGNALNFACSFILIPVMRNFLSLMRLTPLFEYLPIDDHVWIHRVAGWHIFALTMGHVTFHMLHLHELSKILFTSTVWWRLWSYHYITGTVIFCCFMAIFVTAHYKIRRKYYNLFLATHRLMYPIGLAILCIHGWRFFMWFMYIGLLWVAELLISQYRSVMKFHLLRCSDLGSDVIRLEISHAGFKYKPGQYLYLSIPDISNEKHPFTITSAPEERILTLHIRCRGDWTSDVKKLLLGNSKAKDIEYGGMGPAPSIRIEGPYGSAAEHIMDSKTVVLVGSGIGVTPFASVMKSLKIRMDEKKAGRGGDTHFRVEKVYLFWVCRNQDEFDWFRPLISSLEGDDMFEINTYITSNMDLDKFIADYETHKAQGGANKRPLQRFTGRPNWNKTFRKLSHDHVEELISVFLCGPKALGRELRKQCLTFSSLYSRTKFVFRAENF